MNLKETFKDQRTIKLIVSFLILLFLLKFINFPLIISSLKSVNSLFLVVLALIPVNILIKAWRLMIILNHKEKLISLKQSVYLNLAGIALNLFMPASSGDIAKSYYGYKWHGIKEEMLSANIFDKFMALFSIFVIGSIAALFMKFYYISILSLLLSLVFAAIFIYPNIMPWNTFNRLFSKFFKIT
ncbi:MAG TPA: lysylphosphatidylglycerol synthase domain-containing protein, partial [Methanobacterium sp.]|nr:lysylphosphatidylglycerol synthase domain-containing protein [Methanobacterium sp.]